jgi:hypothetical protein
MISRTTLCTVIVACFIGTTPYSYPICAKPGIPEIKYFIVTRQKFKDIAGVALAVGGIGLSAYALAKLGSWLFAKSDTTVAEQAYNTIIQAQAQYSPITAILNKAKLNCNEELACVQSISEPILYELAQAKYYDADITLYLKRLDNTIKTIESNLKELRHSVQSLQLRHHDYQITRLLARLKMIEGMVDTMLPSLKFAHTYLKYHATYFLLFEMEDMLMYRYEPIIQTIDRCPNDMNALREATHQSVMMYKPHHAKAYPYHRYLEQLEDDILKLHIAMHKLAHEYTNRYQAAQALYNKLELIRTTILCSPYYTQEIRDYEHAKLAQAAIDAQQQLAQAIVNAQN